MPAPPAQRCVTCGASLSGAYCSRCGESAHPHDYSIAHFIGELFESLTHVDGRVFASFRALIVEPGRLAREFLVGRRTLVMGPVQLFLVCNIIAFIVQPFSGFAPFTTTLDIHTRGTYWWADMARGMTAARVAERQIPLDQYARAFDETAHFQGKTLVVLMVPVFALGLWALFRRARRFYGEHLVVAFYLYAFFLLMMAVSTMTGTWLAVLASSFGLHIGPDRVDDAVSLVLFATMAVYLFASARLVYGGSRLATATKTVALVGWMAAVYVAYKFVLFFTTFYAT